MSFRMSSPDRQQLTVDPPAISSKHTLHCDRVEHRLTSSPVGQASCCFAVCILLALLLSVHLASVLLILEVMLAPRAVVSLHLEIVGAVPR